MSVGRWRAVVLLLSVAAVAIDTVIGPYVLFPISFTAPVCLAAWYLGRAPGAGTALALVAARFAIVLALKAPDGPLWVMVANAVARAAVLCGLAALTATVARQNRRRGGWVPEGVIPICSFCKNVRCGDGHWEPLEAYVASRAGARFSHGFCDPCGRTRYPQLYDPETGQMI